MAFADPSDVQARWRPLSDSEFEVAATLLDDAADMILSRWPDAADRATPATLRRVTAMMVKRAMIRGDSEGLASRSQGAGPFSVSDTYANPMGNLYLSADEVRLFEPLSSRKAFTVDLVDPQPPGWLL